MKYDVTIGPARPGDIARILEIQIENQKSYLTTAEQKRGYTTLLTLPTYLEDINKHNHILVARHNMHELRHELAGYVITVNKDTVHGNEYLTAFKNKLEEVGHHDPAIIAQVCLTRTLVGEYSGIGRALYVHAEQSLAKTQHEGLLTQINANNDPAWRFHKALGFHEIKQYEDDYGNMMTIVGKQIK